ncbi:sel1 repeat family protein [Stenotrophomonas sp. GD03908]|uniref:Tetratricopeptide repeat protein n=1 Tax=Stenotrophomonas maltophilia TaxID=40324 RepID=A0AAJ2THR0_STEMA|nr:MULTISPECIES: tetratricopeptide repeat protein [Stenotrophomonas]MBH1483561.1 sel1 repeat family protein [Stenotrophomonas maltophilia]MDH0978073.1 sel1 repeat family protein [Stenotrophomonas sp. GD03908]MDQ7295520.1 tetratricopeptide repeat protein [Stenotrophomonas sp. Sm0041]MDZ5763782.1 tetratricopeptide repeat protein [Stenotrophomonas maltophilia]
MQHRNGRTGALAALLCLGLTACQTLAPPSTLPQSQQQALEQRGADGSFEGAFDTAQTFERFNDPRAITYYERAAAVTPWTFHNTKAEEALGRIWISGTLRHADSPHINPAPVLRASWRRGERAYLAAANHGNPYAFYGLAKAYRQRGDAQQALRWDLRAMIYQRYPSRSSQLPDAVAAQGDTVHPLVARIQRRAARGDAEAQVDLGALLEKGIGLPRDPARALQLYQRAGEQGNVFGQYFAGLLLGRSAPGVEKDTEAAARWFAKAEAQRFYMAAPSYWKKAVEPPFFIFSE